MSRTAAATATPAAYQATRRSLCARARMHDGPFGSAAAAQCCDLTVRLCRPPNPLLRHASCRYKLFYDAVGKLKTDKQSTAKPEGTKAE